MTLKLAWLRTHQNPLWFFLIHEHRDDALLAAYLDMEDYYDLFKDTCDRPLEYSAEVIADGVLPLAHEIEGGSSAGPVGLGASKGGGASASMPVGGTGLAGSSLVLPAGLSYKQRVVALKNIPASGFLNHKDETSLISIARGFSKKSLKLRPEGFRECIKRGPDRFGQFLAKYPNLVALNLSGCRSSASALVNLPAGTIPYLKSLNLSDANPTKDIFNKIIFRWPEIEHLDFRNCSMQFVVGLVSTLKDLPPEANLLLKSLELGANLNNQALALIIQRCPDLEKVILDRSFATATTQCLAAELTKIAAAGKISKICYLKLSPVGGELTRIVENCPHLKTLDLSYSLGAAALLNNPLKELAEGINLKIEELDLSHTGEMPVLTSIIARCPQLKKLNLFFCPGAAEALGAALAALAVGQNSNIEILNLSFTGITPNIHAIIARCPELKKLDLEECQGAAGALAAALRALPVGTIRNIQELDLSRTGPVTQADLTTIVERCPNLKKLTLRECAGAITSVVGALMALGVNTNIEELNLYNTEPTPNINTIIACCPNLRVLNLRRCLRAAQALTNAINALPAETIINIQTLNLENTDPAPDMNTIIACCPNLRNLDLGSCLGAGESLIAALEKLPLEKRPKITSLNLNNTKTDITNRRKIQNLLPQLKEFYYSESH